jgi:Arc/MetJ family transcription regulator
MTCDIMMHMHYNHAYKNMYNSYVQVIPMRTTLNIDDDLLEQARLLSGLQEKTALVREGLKALIERECSPSCQAGWLGTPA